MLKLIEWLYRLLNKILLFSILAVILLSSVFTMNYAFGADPPKKLVLNNATCKKLNGYWRGDGTSYSSSTASTSLGWCEINTNTEIKSNETLTIPKGVYIQIFKDTIFTNSGTILINEQIIIDIKGKLINKGKITINNTMQGYTGLFNDGTLDNSGTITIKNSGANTSGINNTGIVNNTGTIIIESTKNKTTELESGIFNEGKIKNDVSGKIIIKNTAGYSNGITNVGTIDNFGTITISNTGGQTWGIENGVDGKIQNMKSGKITISNGGGLSIGLWSDGSIKNSGTITLAKLGGARDTEMWFDENASFSNDGIVCGSVGVQKEGFLPNPKIQAIKTVPCK